MAPKRGLGRGDAAGPDLGRRVAGVPGEGLRAAAATPHVSPPGPRYLSKGSELLTSLHFPSIFSKVNCYGFNGGINTALHHRGTTSANNFSSTE